MAAAALLLTVVVVVAVFGARYAAGRAAGSLGPDPGTDAAALVDAHALWDNPFQRLLYLASAVVGREEDGSAPSCPEAGGRRIVTTVAAYTLFGVAVAHAQVRCDGSVDSVP